VSGLRPLTSDLRCTFVESCDLRGYNTHTHTHTQTEASPSHPSDTCSNEVEEGDGHQDVEGPVDSGGAGVPGAPRPQRIDLRVDGPRHWTHTYEREMGGELLWRVLCSETQLSCCVGGS